MTWGINQVDEEILSIGLLANNVLDVLWVGNVVVKRDSSGLDSNTTFLLIGTGIHRTSLTSLGSRDNTSLGKEGVGEGRFSVIDVGNDGHVTDIGCLVHQLADLLDCEAVGQ